MELVKWIVLVTILVGWSFVVRAQNAPEEQLLPARDKVSKDLIVLRDSVNSTIALLSQEEVNATDPRRPAYLKMNQDLTRYKIQLDRTVEDIVNSEWNADVRTRTAHTIEDVRREYKRILSEIKQETTPE